MRIFCSVPVQFDAGLGLLCEKSFAAGEALCSLSISLSPGLLRACAGAIGIYGTCLSIYWRAGPESFAMVGRCRAFPVRWCFHQLSLQKTRSLYRSLRVVYSLCL